MPDQTEQFDDYNDPTPEQALEWVESFTVPVTPFVLRLTSQKLTEEGRPLVASAVNKIELGDRRIDVDDLVAFAAAFGVEPALMLSAPHCDTCNGAPPAGFTCQTCGRGTQ